jgi:hypothetical protein
MRRRGSHIFLHNRSTEADEAVSLTPQQPFTPTGRLMVLISVRGCVNQNTIMRLEGLSNLKKKIADLIGDRNRDLLACSTVHQQTMLSCTPFRP